MTNSYYKFSNDLIQIHISFMTIRNTLENKISVDVFAKHWVFWFLLFFR